ncbi:MAG: polymer-forming cytoskeletal protein [Lachnospiraceae bacterium]|nr:polymer-forming cytoskeletal protein [Lachnospiraceae bacterium]
MGFFSDLKEDLSQAVNELIPEDEQAKNVDSTETTDTVSLDEMLKNIDDIQLPVEETHHEEKDFVSADNTTEDASADAETAGTAEEPENIADNAEEAEAENGELERMLAKMLEEDSVSEKPEVPEIREENKGASKNMEMEMSREASDETSVITGGMIITGDIVSEGSIDVIGTVNGNIDALGKLNITGHINGNSKAAEIYAESAKINGEIISEGAVKVGASSVIIGNITATSAAIAGAVKGDIDVRGPVILDASAIVMGNIKSKSVQINNGAVIEGMCSQCYADVSPTSFFDDYKPDVVKSKSK